MNPPTTTKPTTKPKTDNRLRVYRGGCWDNYGPSWVRAASRDTDVSAYRNIFLGFRCARGGSERRVKP
jgi:formylglycine-generating enzyme required for sulfatase activity